MDSLGIQDAALPPKASKSERKFGGVRRATDKDGTVGVGLVQTRRRLRVSSAASCAFALSNRQHVATDEAAAKKKGSCSGRSSSMTGGQARMRHGSAFAIDF